jgi:hypothetical protein
MPTCRSSWGSSATAKDVFLSGVTSEPPKPGTGFRNIFHIQLCASIVVHHAMGCAMRIGSVAASIWRTRSVSCRGSCRRRQNRPRSRQGPGVLCGSGAVPARTGAAAGCRPRSCPASRPACGVPGLQRCDGLCGEQGLLARGHDARSTGGEGPDFHRPLIDRQLRSRCGHLDVEARVQGTHLAVGCVDPQRPVVLGRLDEDLPATRTMRRSSVSNRMSTALAVLSHSKLPSASVSCRNSPVAVRWSAPMPSLLLAARPAASP